MRQLLILTMFMALVPGANRVAAAVLFSNGSIVTNPSAGAGGFDVSQASEDFNTLGFLAAAPARLADDFTIADPAGWQVNRVTVNAYVAGTYTAPPVGSPLTGLNVSLWRGAPEASGSDLVATSTAVAVNAFSGTFRVGNGPANFLDTSRPVFDLAVDFPSTILPAGEYWIDYSLTGGNAFSPMVMASGGANPVTASGNAQRKLSPAGDWVTLIGGLTTQGLGFPFVVEGAIVVPEPMSAILIIAPAVLLRRRPHLAPMPG
ncbi:MAG TPA: hypothetical protein PLD59_00810 [Tepidisphaeraceae bacterium]|nr:hypothetical protein [Tepidisphaeraceae bacterium]